MHPSAVYRDRSEAGRYLARQLVSYQNTPNLVVLSLPRGGVPVGYEVAAALQAPLDVFIVRKLGMPGHTELAIGAIAHGITVLNEEIADHVSPASIEKIICKEKIELAIRESRYKEHRPDITLSYRPVILVDDGIATGASMRAAVQTLRQAKPASIVVATPVGASESCELLRSVADQIICAFTPNPFYSVGLWYEDFSQTTDEEVIEFLNRSKAAHQQRTLPKKAGHAT